MSAVPPNAINFRSADGSQLEILRYIRFMLTLGDITLPVEALVLPNLGPDKMLLDNSIMGAFGASLNWHTEELSFANYYIKVKATHRIRNSTNETPIVQCSLFFFFSILLIFFALLFSLPPARNSDPGSHSRLFSPHTHYRSCLAFLSREDLSCFFPRRLASNR